MIKVGITHGDINGISYEVIMKALADERVCEFCTPVIFGSAKLLGYFRKVLGIDNFQVNQIQDATQARAGVVNLVNITDKELKVDLGVPTPESGDAAMLSLRCGVEALRDGAVDVFVTAPVNKANIHSEEFALGHTEYLQEMLGRSDDEKALMILFADALRVALVTTHLAIKDVPDALTKDIIVEKIRTFASVLRRDFGIDGPKIAVLALNPHAGDNGLVGMEEQTVITPAIDEAFEQGIFVFGPYPADGFFGAESWRNFDGVLAMYHDQGLTPFKIIAGVKGVNFTAGLCKIRTSPDHGTGYDIAGKNIANPESMRQAIYSAVDIFRLRCDFDRASANPLRRQYVERGADNTVDLSQEDDKEI